MKLRMMHILALAAAASLPLLAQQPAPSPQPQTPGSSQTASPQQTSPQAAEPVPSTPSAPEAANSQLRQVSGELEDKLDTKSAKTGDSVVIKTTEKATTTNGVEIPKGSRILGRVTDVEAKGQSGENSRVTIQFDQAEIKGGQKLPIRSVIQNVSPASGGGSSAATGGSPAPAPSAGAGDPAGARASGATAGSAGSAQGASPSAASPSASSGYPAAGTVVARNGNIAIRTTDIPGVLVAGNLNGQPFSNAAGALLGARQDIQLDGGTKMVVAIMQAPAPVNSR